MRQKCVCCVAKGAPPSQYVMSVRSTIAMNVLTPTLVGPMLFVKYNTNDSWSGCNVVYLGASPWEGKSGAEVGIVNRKVVRRARAGQTFPHR